MDLGADGWQTFRFVTLPMIFASDAFYSLAAAPALVHTLSRALPLSHVIDGVSAGLSGSLSSTVTPLLFIFGYTVLALALAVLTFRWDPDAAPLRRSVRAAHAST